MSSQSKYGENVIRPSVKLDPKHPWYDIRHPRGPGHWLTFENIKLTECCTTPLNSQDIKGMWLRGYVTIVSWMSMSLSQPFCILAAEQTLRSRLWECEISSFSISETMGDMLRLKAPHGRKLFSWCEYFDEFPPPSTHYSLAKYWGVNLDTRAQLPRARHRSYWPRSAQRKMSRLCFMFCVTGQKFELETRISVIMSSQDVVSICWEVILRLQRIWPIKVAGIVAGKCWCLTFDYSKLCGIVFPKIFEFASEDRTVQCLSDQSEGLRKRHAILTKINKISDVLSLILDPVMFYPCHNILSEQSNKEAVPAMVPKKYKD